MGMERGDWGNFYFHIMTTGITAVSLVKGSHWLPTRTLSDKEAKVPKKIKKPKPVLAGKIKRVVLG